MEKVPMTAAGLAALEEEFRHLKNVERPAISKAIGVDQSLHIKLLSL